MSEPLSEPLSGPFRKFDTSQEKEWLEWRLEGIGASSCATLFDCNPFESQLELWNKLTKNPAAAAKAKNDGYNLHRMNKGKKLETVLFPELRRAFKMDIEEQMCLQHPDIPYLRATLDGINVQNKCIWEMKFMGNHEKYLSLTSIPMAHRLQIQQQLLLAQKCIDADAQWKAYYIYSNGLGPTGIDWRFLEEKPDPDMQESIIERVKYFWENHVVPQIPPSAAPIDAVERDDEACIERCKRLKEIMRYVDEADQIKKELKEMGADVPFSCAGVNYSFNNKMSVARYKDVCELPCVLKALKDNGLSIDEFRSPPIVQRRIWIDHE